MEDIIAKKIVEILSEFEEEHELEDLEKEKIATLFSCIIRSSFDSRLFFYTETSQIMQELKKRLGRKKDEMINELMGKKKSSIIN